MSQKSDVTNNSSTTLKTINLIANVDAYVNKCKFTFVNYKCKLMGFSEFVGIAYFCKK